ncbi:MAG TPA: DUF4136 domain-containing protein, partial [Steroidobacteraceae bacterium]
KSALIGAAMLAMLSACAVGPEIRTQSAPELDLSRYATYDYVARAGTDRGNYRSITTRYLQEAVDREMAARGLKRSDHPDLLIDFHTTMRDRVRGQYWGGWGGAWGYGWGPGWGYGWGWGPGWWGGPGPWGPGGWNTIEAYTEGTLTIDVIDAKNKEAIWSGSAISRVYQAALENPRASIDETVGHIFAKFPRAPLQAQQSASH